MGQKMPDFQNLSGQLTISNRLAKKYGVNVAILVGWLLETSSAKENPFTWFEAPAKTIMSETPLSIYQIGYSFTVLEHHDIIKRKCEGFPSIRSVKLDFDKIEKEL